MHRNQATEEKIMPIYEFQCDDCRHQFESIVMSPAALTDLACPLCHSKTIHKIISAGVVKSGKATQSRLPTPTGCAGAKSGFS